MEQLATDSDLTAETNILLPLKEVTGRIAEGAQAKYRFKGTKGKELFLNFDRPEGDEISYLAVITDKNGKNIFKTKIHGIRGLAARHGSYPFKPPVDEEYILTLTGKSGYGVYTITLK